MFNSKIKRILNTSWAIQIKMKLKSSNKNIISHILAKAAITFIFNKKPPISIYCG